MKTVEPQLSGLTEVVPASLEENEKVEKLVVPWKGREEVGVTLVL